MRDTAQRQLERLFARPIAHRGLHTCGAPGPVENSIGAARAAVAAGFGIECDVLLSRDGEAMVFHDETLDRLTTSSGRVGDYDAAALSRLRLGNSLDVIPSLAAFLNAIDGRVPLVIEIKSQSDGDMRLADRTIEVLADYHGPAALESFDPRVVLRCRSLRPERPIGLVGPTEDETDSAAVALAACDFVSWSIEHLDRAPSCYSNVPRSTWTVRTPAQVERAAHYGAQIVFEGFKPPVKDG